MTKLKIAGSLPSKVAEGITPAVQRIYDAPGGTILALVELRHTERTQVADVEAEPTVTTKIIGMEVPDVDQTTYFRDLMRTLYANRTASGTLDFTTGAVKLTPTTLRNVQGQINGVTLARHRAVLAQLVHELQLLAGSSKLNGSEMRLEVGKVRDGLHAYLWGETIGADGQVEFDLDTDPAVTQSIVDLGAPAPTAEQLDEVEDAAGEGAHDQGEEDGEEDGDDGVVEAEIVDDPVADDTFDEIMGVESPPAPPAPPLFDDGIGHDEEE